MKIKAIHNTVLTTENKNSSELPETQQFFINKGSEYDILSIDRKPTGKSKITLELWVFSPHWKTLGSNKVLMAANPSEGIYYDITVERQIFLDLIAWCEGTDKDLNTTPKGYDIIFGYKTFSDFSRHPRTVVNSGGYKSSAAGRYQIMDFTEDTLLKELPNLPNFSPLFQDQRALRLIERRKALSHVDNMDLINFLKACANEWASLPFSPYGQPTKTLKQVQEAFNTLKKAHENHDKTTN